MLKKWIKKIPLVGSVAVNLKRKISPTSYETSEKYWVERYKNGGNSGQGSYNSFAEHKAEVINNFVSQNNIKTVIEFGSGDGNQVKYFNFPSYIGFEISQDAIDLCNEKYANDGSKKFFHLNEFQPMTADLTISLDVIYCLTEDDVYLEYMNRLFSSSSQYVLVFSSNHANNKLSSPHIKHRKFLDWVKENKPAFELISFVKNKFAETEDFVSDFYFFKLNAKN